MEVGIVERDVALEQPDEDDAPARRDVVEGLGHRRGISSGIDNQRRQIAVSQVLQRGDDVAPRVDGVPHAGGLAAEFQARLRHVGDDQLPAVGRQERQNRQPDRAGADHEYFLAALHLPARRGVAADAQRLD